MNREECNCPSCDPELTARHVMGPSVVEVWEALEALRDDVNAECREIIQDLLRHYADYSYDGIMLRRLRKAYDRIKEEFPSGTRR